MLSLSVLLPAAALTRYDDHGDPHYLVSERVLLALRRLDWPTATEINEQARFTRRESLAASQALHTLVRRGYAKQRRVGQLRLFVYQLDASAFAAKPPWRDGRRRAA